MKFCSLYSGSSGNSIFVASENAKILIDAGLPGKSIESALKAIGEEPKNLNGIFITHEHSDHIKGVGVISRKYDVPVFANEATWRSMEPMIGSVKPHNIKLIQNGEIDFGDLEIYNYKLPHDAAAPSSYTVTHKGKKIGVATDLGHFSDEVMEALRGSDILLIESNHDEEMLKFGPYPYTLKRRILSNVGHVSNEACGEAVVKLLDGNFKNIILGHLSNTNNYPELAYQTVYNILTENGVKLDSDVSLTVAKRGVPSCLLEV